VSSCNVSGHVQNEGRGYLYLEKTVDNLPAYIVLMRDEQCRFEELVGTARDSVLAMEVFIYCGISSPSSSASCNHGPL